MNYTYKAKHHFVDIDTPPFGEIATVTYYPFDRDHPTIRTTFTEMDYLKKLFREKATGEDYATRRAAEEGLRWIGYSSYHNAIKECLPWWDLPDDDAALRTIEP